MTPAWEGWNRGGLRIMENVTAFGPMDYGINISGLADSALYAVESDEPDGGLE